MRLLVAYDICALMEYRTLHLFEACTLVVMEKWPAIGGRGGLIAVDKQGNVSMPFNTEGMYRGEARVRGPRKVSIYR